MSKAKEKIDAQREIILELDKLQNIFQSQDKTLVFRWTREEEANQVVPDTKALSEEDLLKLEEKDYPVNKNKNKWHNLGNIWQETEMNNYDYDENVSYMQDGEKLSYNVIHCFSDPRKMQTVLDHVNCDSRTNLVVYLVDNDILQENINENGKYDCIEEECFPEDVTEYILPINMCYYEDEIDNRVKRTRHAIKVLGKFNKEDTGCYDKNELGLAMAIANKISIEHFNEDISENKVAISQDDDYLLKNEEDKNINENKKKTDEIDEIITEEVEYLLGGYSTDAIKEPILSLSKKGFIANSASYHKLIQSMLRYNKELDEKMDKEAQRDKKLGPILQRIREKRDGKRKEEKEIEL